MTEPTGNYVIVGVMTKDGRTVGYFSKEGQQIIRDGLNKVFDEVWDAEREAQYAAAFGGNDD